jgi:DNA-binding NarL/FixJ family response regulator
LRIFILEDDPFRTEYMIGYLDKAFNKPNIVLSSDAEAAKKELAKELFDLVCLDHDLGGQVFVDSSEKNTGYQVAKYIKENNIKYKVCMIHSLNFMGAMRMKSVLPGAEYLPVTSWNVESLKNLYNA